MKRSTGVTTVAVLSLIGSIFTLLMGIVFALAMFYAPVPRSNEFHGSPMFFKGVTVTALFIYLLLALWGTLTGIGLLRLKNWARISTVVFSVLLIIMSGFGVLVSLFLTIPPVPNKPADPSAITAIRVFMGAFWLVLLGIGTWWLVFFNRVRVREQFVPAFAGGFTAQGSAAAQASYAGPTTGAMRRKRPLSITIIACFLLAGCVLIPLNLWFHTPAAFFTKLLNGEAAATYYLAITLLQLYLGIGLLRLQPAARRVGIAYFIFCFVNAASFNFAPGGRARMLAFLDMTRSRYPWLPPWQDSALQFDSTLFLIFGVGFGLVPLVVALYLLITRRQAFEGALPEPAGGIDQT